MASDPSLLAQTMLDVLSKERDQRVREGSSLHQASNRMLFDLRLIAAGAAADAQEALNTATAAGIALRTVTESR